MLPKEDSITEIPEITVCVAHAAFPEGNVYIWLRIERLRQHWIAHFGLQQGQVKFRTTEEMPLRANGSIRLMSLNLFMVTTKSYLSSRALQPRLDSQQRSLA